ncbi:MAG: c-type cytochrome domain-containing protein [Planctomycetaceae bacterium]
MRTLLSCLAFGLLFLVATDVAFAQTAEQRKELGVLKKDLGTVSSLIRKKEFAEAQQVYDTVDAKLTEIAAALGVAKDDRKLLGLAQMIERGRESLEIAQAKAEGRPPRIGPSFAGEIAPLIEGKCVSCHGGANPRNGLDLSTFAGWKQGGQGGPLLIPGNPARSLLIAAVATPDAQKRMPKNAAALSAEEIALLAKWVEKGANFDGDSEATLLADLGKENTPEPTVIIPKPTGSETVSFTRDVAPFMANLCVRCHNSNRQSGGLSLETFHDMMKGGDSGRVVLPGNVEGSRLFRLTGGLELPRMPADNQVRITRKNYEDLKKWFEEGNTFDGDDPKTPLRTYATAAMENMGGGLANYTPAEFDKHRFERTELQWKKAAPTDTYRYVEDGEFLVFGNVSSERLQQVAGWAQEHLKSLREIFGGTGKAWKGRLTIFVFKDRFGYEEFNQVNNGRRAPEELLAHTVVTADYDDAYVCLQEVGDEATPATGGLRVALIDQMTGAFLSREGAQLPDWVLRGTGLAMAFSVDRQNTYLRDQDVAAKDFIKVVLNPVDIFADGTFSPAGAAAVGYTLVKFMINNGGPAKFGQFIQAMRGGQSAAEAVRSVYNADLNALARGYAGSL